MKELLLDPEKAQRIADNSVKTFREHYLTPAAKVCYWRALWTARAKVLSNVSRDLEGRPAVKRSLR
ncbi:hypothetical protein BJX96DRAFT_155061 [Aspergillus floccosus]